MRRVVIVCPGRGSYGREELGCLRQLEADSPDRSTEWLDRADRIRKERSDPGVRELDAMESFRPSCHLRGAQGSGLIYCGSWIDWQRIDPEKIEPVAVVGNSLGWYTALAVSGSLDFDSGFTLVDSMGRIQDDLALGQQLIYPLVGENWQRDPEREECFQKALELVAGQVWESIRFGGFSVLGGESQGLDVLETHLAPVELGGRSYPFRLAGSKGFHTPLAAEVSREAVKTLTPKIGWSAPQIPLIDGQGRVWSPWSTDPAELAQYTLERQVVGLFDFQAAVRGALTEFGPEAILLLGPGDSLGAAVGQTLIRSGWWGIQDRADFQSRQNSNVPVVVSMGRSEQAQTVLR